jgi:hypothetical protein
MLQKIWKKKKPKPKLVTKFFQFQGSSAKARHQVFRESSSKKKKMPNQNHQNLSNTSKSVSQTQKNSEWRSEEENHEEMQAPITEYLKFLSFTTNPRPSPRGSRLTSMPLSTGSSSTAFWQIFQSRLSRDGKGHKFSSSKWQTLSLTRLKTKSRCRKRKIGRRGPKRMELQKIHS